MPYGILQFAKRRGGPASALEKHHERKKQQYASNPDIDTERSIASSSSEWLAAHSFASASTLYRYFIAEYSET